MPTAGWVRLSVATKKAGGTTAATVVAGTGNGTDATVVEVAEACQVAAWAGAGEKTLAVGAARGGGGGGGGFPWGADPPPPRGGNPPEGPPPPPPPPARPGGRGPRPHQGWEASGRSAGIHGAVGGRVEDLARYLVRENPNPKQCWESINITELGRPRPITIEHTIMPTTAKGL
jgi:hypothetical protein